MTDADWFDRDGTPMPEEWTVDNQNRWKIERRVGNTRVGDAVVSTVWLGLDHNHSGYGAPLIFETMIFGGEYAYELTRYSTELDAMRGHLTTVEFMEAGLGPGWLQ